MSDFKNVTLVKHPVVNRDLTILRDVNTNISEFRAAIKRIAMILAYHALKELPQTTFEVETPIQKTTGYDIDQGVMVVPILRAGLSLSDALLQFIPDARVGHLGMERNETTHQPEDYYSNIPDGVEDDMVLVVDPMLATGGSAHDALSFLEDKGAQHLRFVSLICAPEGLQKLEEEHPNVHAITAAIDEKLNDDAFIVPGLGDAGDRYFGTT
ncbi:uracil phosphoribosyltransferase [Fodinibius sp. AD559]|uniref:uracil phosphoribosyltransferase n=1 Tax=Fodinibius sp. AD559 TaxID=3424179 RepID=UPI0040468CC2